MYSVLRTMDCRAEIGTLNESVLEMESEAAEDACPHTLDGQSTRPPSSMKPVNRIHRGKRMREGLG